MQRVGKAAVHVDGRTVASIGHGLVILVGVTHGDSEEQAKWLAQKVAGLRVFEDTDGKLNVSLQEIGGEALVVSQFTLYGDARKGRRPSLIAAARPEEAEPLVTQFADLLQAEGIRVQSGLFGAQMLVEIHNDGPVTLILER